MKAKATGNEGDVSAGEHKSVVAAGAATQPGGRFSRRDVLAGAAVAGATAAVSPLLNRVAFPATADSAPATQPGAGEEAGRNPITLNVNGKPYTLQLEPRVTLLDALREYAGLTGVKKGCDHGQCGACTVLVDDRRINACLTFAMMHQQSRITTIEGLAQDDQLHPLQQAFIDHDAFQCGYCTPGQICSGVGLVSEGHAKTDDDIRELMSGNICRCGAYPNIVDAVRQTLHTQKA